MAESLLDLDTLGRRDYYITIDGESYYFRSPDELTLLDSHRLHADGQVLDKLFSERIDGNNEHLAEKIDATEREILGIILPDLGSDVVDRLSERQRVQIIRAFTNRWAQKGQEASGKTKSTTPEKLLHDSSGSTEATRNAG